MVGEESWLSWPVTVIWRQSLRWTSRWFSQYVVLSLLLEPPVLVIMNKALCFDHKTNSVAVCLRLGGGGWPINSELKWLTAIAHCLRRELVLLLLPRAKQSPGRRGGSSTGAEWRAKSHCEQYPLSPLTRDTCHVKEIPGLLNSIIALVQSAFDKTIREYLCALNLFIYLFLFISLSLFFCHPLSSLFLSLSVFFPLYFFFNLLSL